MNNTAATDGAAIYATDVERCTYAPDLKVNDTTPTNSYTRSIFRLDIFQFKPNSNRVLKDNIQVHEVATAPSWFIVSPKVCEIMEHDLREKSWGVSMPFVC